MEQIFMYIKELVSIYWWCRL